MPEMLYGTLSVLIVSSAERLNATMLSSLPESRYQPITAVPDASAARFCAAERPFLGRGAGERPHAARSGAAGVIRLSQ